MANTPATYSYRIDARDRIVWVDEMWLAFARENGASHLTEDSVIDHPLWDFVKGKRVRKLFQAIHDRVRTAVQSVTLPIRCDSPTLQRHMRLNITREANDCLLYDVALIRTVPTTYYAVLDPIASRSESTLTMCSICKRVMIEPVGWLDLEDAAARIRLFENEVPKLRQCICSECMVLMRDAANGNAA